jgi:hypothetical protein
MNELTFRPFKADEIINARDRFAAPKVRKPEVDMVISKLVGKSVYFGTPEYRQVMDLIVKWKRKKSDPEAMDTFLKNEEFIRELRKLLHSPLYDGN